MIALLDGNRKKIFAFNIILADLINIHNPFW